MSQRRVLFVLFVARLTVIREPSRGAVRFRAFWARTNPLSHGLLNSASFVVDMLNESGVRS